MNLIHINQNVKYNESLLEDTYRMATYTSLNFGGKTELFILKMHLCIEEMFEKIIKNSFPYPNSILKSELSFSQKHGIIKALLYRDDIALMFRDIDLLNKIRNELAHNLESQKYAQRLAELDTNLEISSGFELTPESLNLLQKRYQCLYGSLLDIYRQI